MTEPSKKREHAQDTSPQHRSPAHKKRKTLPDALSQKMGVTEVLSQSQEFNFGSQITNVTKRRRKNNDTQMKLSFDQQEDQEENVHYDDYANETVHHDDDQDYDDDDQDYDDDDQDYDDDDQIRKLRTTHNNNNEDEHEESEVELNELDEEELTCLQSILIKWSEELNAGYEITNEMLCVFDYCLKHKEIPETIIFQKSLTTRVMKAVKES
eukprot:371001_1